MKNILKSIAFSIHVTIMINVLIYAIANDSLLTFAGFTVLTLLLPLHDVISVKISFGSKGEKK
jgi:hypothetical protein